jgi:hypothetical protein
MGDKSSLVCRYSVCTEYKRGCVSAQSLLLNLFIKCSGLEKGITTQSFGRCANKIRYVMDITVSERIQL